MQVIPHLSLWLNPFSAHLGPSLCSGGWPPWDVPFGYLCWLASTWVWPMGVPGRGLRGRRRETLLHCFMSGVVIDVHPKLWLLLGGLSSMALTPTGLQWHCFSSWPFQASHLFVHFPNSPRPLSGPFINISLFETSGVNSVACWDPWLLQRPILTCLCLDCKIRA